MADADHYNEDGELFSSDDIENRHGGGSKNTENRCGGGGEEETFNLNGRKGTEYLKKRGWTLDAIKNAILNGKTGTSTNKATGNECSVYNYPGSKSQYVVIDNVTRSVVQLSDLHNPGWAPDPGITWFHTVTPRFYKGITWFQEGKVYK